MRQGGGGGCGEGLELGGKGRAAGPAGVRVMESPWVRPGCDEGPRQGKVGETPREPRAKGLGAVTLGIGHARGRGCPQWVSIRHALGRAVWWVGTVRGTGDLDLRGARFGRERQMPGCEVMRWTWFVQKTPTSVAP